MLTWWEQKTEITVRLLSNAVITNMVKSDYPLYPTRISIESVFALTL